MNMRGAQLGDSSAPWSSIEFKPWFIAGKSQKALLTWLVTLREFLWGCAQPAPFHVTSLAKWSQGSWTIYMVAGFSPTKPPMETRQKLHGTFWLSLKVHPTSFCCWTRFTGQPTFKGGELDSTFWWWSVVVTQLRTLWDERCCCGIFRRVLSSDSAIWWLGHLSKRVDPIKWLSD